MISIEAPAAAGAAASGKEAGETGVAPMVSEDDAATLDDSLHMYGK